MSREYFYSSRQDPLRIWRCISSGCGMGWSMSPQQGTCLECRKPWGLSTSKKRQQSFDGGSLARWEGSRVHLHLETDIFLNMCVHMCAYVFTCACLFTCMYTCVYTCMFICVCTCVFTPALTSLASLASQVALRMLPHLLSTGLTDGHHT